LGPVMPVSMELTMAQANYNECVASELIRVIPLGW
jgi:hypothetical protein